LRDSWVEVDAKGKSMMRKINTAYSLGGAECAIKTINTNFNLNITDYVAVSLHQLWKVIDLVCEAEGSGIKIQITEAERKQLNYLADSEGFGVKHVKKAGEVELDGGQAMTYSRIRKIDSDGVRAMRQQKVLNCLFEKAKSIPLSKYPGLLKEVMKNVETSLSYDEIFKFAPLLAGGSLSLESKTIPNDDVVAEGKIFSDTRGAWVWKYDLDEATRYIYKFLYNID
jgi:LCP family protein required for cell wall assembly